jgi:NAD(P)-dependent dehydrogenase (short-subunit alcohol dehydrogenase family)
MTDELGINHAFVQELLERGCSVVVADINLRPEAEATLAKHPYPPKQEEAPSAVFKQTDQSDWAQISDLWEFSLKNFGQVDLVCPGAGIWEPPSSNFWIPPGTSDISRDDPQAVVGQWYTFAVNTTGPLRLAQLAFQYWIENKTHGNLLFVASMGGYCETIGTPLYYASKAALLSATKSFAHMRSRLGIRVAAVCPGPCYTPLFLQEWALAKVRPTDFTMTPKQCAEVMLKIAQDPEYGDGQIVEVMMMGTRAEPRLNVRLVPYEKLLPDGVGTLGDDNNIIKEEEKLWAHLSEKGMTPL